MKQGNHGLDEARAEADAYYERRAKETGDPHYEKQVIAFTAKEWECINTGVPCADCDCTPVRLEVLLVEREERQARGRREQAMMDRCRDRLLAAADAGKESNGRPINLKEGDE